MTKIINPQLTTIINRTTDKVKVNEEQRSRDFKEIFGRELSNFTISKHATERMEKRGITLQPRELLALNSAMDKLKEKGSNDSLILLNGTAYIVNPQKKVIITAIDKSGLTENIITGIDSAIII